MSEYTDLRGWIKEVDEKVDEHAERITKTETHLVNQKESMDKLVVATDKNGSWLRGVFGSVVVLLVTIIIDMFLNHKLLSGI